MNRNLRFIREESRVLSGNQGRELKELGTLIQFQDHNSLNLTHG